MDARHGSAETSMGRLAPTKVSPPEEGGNCIITDTPKKRQKVEREELLRQGHDRTTDCEWAVSVVTTSDKIRSSWKAMLPEWEWRHANDEEWPLCIIGTGNDIAGVLGKAAHTPVAAPMLAKLKSSSVVPVLNLDPPTSL